MELTNTLRAKIREAKLQTKAIAQALATKEKCSDLGALVFTELIVGVSALP